MRVIGLIEDKHGLTCRPDNLGPDLLVSISCRQLWQERVKKSIPLPISEDKYDCRRHTIEVT